MLTFDCSVTLAINLCVWIWYNTGQVMQTLLFHIKDMSKASRIQWALGQDSKWDSKWMNLKKEGELQQHNYKYLVSCLPSKWFLRVTVSTSNLSGVIVAHWLQLVIWILTDGQNQNGGAWWYISILLHWTLLFPYVFPTLQWAYVLVTFFFSLTRHLKIHEESRIRNIKYIFVMDDFNKIELFILSLRF